MDERTQMEIKCGRLHRFWWWRFFSVALRGSWRLFPFWAWCWSSCWLLVFFRTAVWNRFSRTILICWILQRSLRRGSISSSVSCSRPIPSSWYALMSINLTRATFFFFVVLLYYEMTIIVVFWYFDNSKRDCVANMEVLIFKEFSHQQSDYL